MGGGEANSSTSQGHHHATATQVSALLPCCVPVKVKISKKVKPRPHLCVDAADGESCLKASLHVGLSQGPAKHTVGAHTTVEGTLWWGITADSSSRGRQQQTTDGSRGRRRQGQTADRGRQQQGQTAAGPDSRSVDE